MKCYNQRRSDEVYLEPGGPYETQVNYKHWDRYRDVDGIIFGMRRICH